MLIKSHVCVTLLKLNDKQPEKVEPELVKFYLSLLELILFAPSYLPASGVSISMLQWLEGARLG